ncbi:OmpA family protein [Sphingomonas sp.]|uniref:OmpA family protein n=1 Tax=Sphingomonas sp. TaxID=28214 RepID=UPI001D7F8A10|nr:OmpA family protein [Sphingomonas sp.]MBX9797307.1 OmpA family protein [Sphingomonas sp.]
MGRKFLLLAALLCAAGCDAKTGGNEVAAAAKIMTAPAPTPMAPPAPAPEKPAATAAAGPADEFKNMQPGASPPPSGVGASLPGDAKGASDYPGIPRFDGAKITKYSQVPYDSAEFVIAKLTGTRPDPSVARLEGKLTVIEYATPIGNTGLAIFRNYLNALKAAGFQVVFECADDPSQCLNIYAVGINRYDPYANGPTRYLSAMRRADGLRVSVLTQATGEKPGFARMIVMEPKALGNSMKVVDAAGIGRDVASSGKAILYAIQFDTDKASLRPESAPQLAAIAEWLTASGTHALVVGHTDANGAFGYNVGLSQRRAEAVVAALTRDYKVTPAALTAFGNGMAAPIASNRTPEGQARNRRVEVVEMTR